MSDGLTLPEFDGDKLLISPRALVALSAVILLTFFVGIASLPNLLWLTVSLSALAVLVVLGGIEMLRRSRRDNE